MDTSNNNKPSLEKIMAELKGITAKLEDKNISIDKAIAGFEKGMNLIKLAKEELTRIDEKISKIINKNKESE